MSVKLEGENLFYQGSTHSVKIGPGSIAIYFMSILEPQSRLSTHLKLLETNSFGVRKWMRRNYFD
jgi:hypothetical protein